MSWMWAQLRGGFSYFCGDMGTIPILREGMEYIMDVPEGMDLHSVVKDLIAGRFAQGGWPTRDAAAPQEEC